MSNIDFFSQFLLSPVGIDKDMEIKIKRSINHIANAYLKYASAAGVDGRFYPFLRPLYMLVAISDSHVFVLYSNENAVRGQTQWYFTDFRGKGIVDKPLESFALLARRDIGLELWRGFGFETSWLDIDDEFMFLNMGHAQFNNEHRDEMLRRRTVNIEPIFSGRGFLLDKNLCFVLMPFKDELRPVYEDHIKKVIEKEGMECQRADDIFRNTAIIEDIWEMLNKAKIVIADLTGKNPNVFYEVGIAHTIGKEVILITQNLDDVPFDLRHLRYIQYDYTPPGMKAFEKHLRNTLINIK